MIKGNAKALPSFNTRGHTLPLVLPHADLEAAVLSRDAENNVTATQKRTALLAVLFSLIQTLGGGDKETMDTLREAFVAGIGQLGIGF